MKFYEIIVAAAYVLSYDMPEFFSCKNLTYNVNIYVFDELSFMFKLCFKNCNNLNI